MVKKKTRYIIWLGSVFNDEAVLKCSAISPAGNKWQLKFINGINESEQYKVVSVGHRPERAFPKGKLFVINNDNFSLPGINQLLVPYLNLPYLRDFFINIQLIVKYLLVFLENGKPAHMITYNSYQYNCFLALFIKYVFNVNWVYILADPVNDKTGRYNVLHKLSDSHIYLSYGMFNKSNKQKKIHIDGGIDILDIAKTEQFKSSTPYVLYTGRISKHNGIELLIDAMDFVNPSLNLVICGKGHNSKLIDATVDNSRRIKYLGMVDENELESLVQNAEILVNPRLISNKTNNSIFPSKILEYIAYKKPIISTKTFGISDEYNNIIEFVHDDNPLTMANKINEVFMWDKAKREKRTMEITDFIVLKKTWSITTNSFIKWLNE